MASPEQSAPRRSKRVLIVDGNEVASRVAEAALLRSADISCERAADVASALATLENQHFDLVVLELDLPGESGLRLLERVVRDGERTRALVLTRFTTPDLEEAARDAGAREFLAKPFDPADLRRRVRDLLGLPRTTSGELILQAELATRRSDDLDDAEGELE